MTGNTLVSQVLYRSRHSPYPASSPTRTRYHNQLFFVAQALAHNVLTDDEIRQPYMHQESDTVTPPVPLSFTGSASIVSGGNANMCTHSL